MSKGFRASLALQRLDCHKEHLSHKGFEFLEDRADEARKNHDLYDWLTDTWIECKTDRSRFTERLLLEVKANVPVELVRSLPFRRPIPFAEALPTVLSLPPRYNAFVLDVVNLEPNHFLSYLFQETNKHFLFDAHKLRRLVTRSRFDFLVGGFEGEHWRTIAAIVPLAACVSIQ